MATRGNVIVAAQIDELWHLSLVPSLFMISQMTPEGWEAASLAKSYSRFGLPGTCEYSGILCAQREDVTRTALDPKALSLD